MLLWALVVGKRNPFEKEKCKGDCFFSHFDSYHFFLNECLIACKVLRAEKNGTLVLLTDCIQKLETFFMWKL
jgi:hypothetical protein